MDTKGEFEYLVSKLVEEYNVLPYKEVADSLANLSEYYKGKVSQTE